MTPEQRDAATRRESASELVEERLRVVRHVLGYYGAHPERFAPGDAEGDCSCPAVVAELFEDRGSAILAEALGFEPGVWGEDLQAWVDAPGRTLDDVMARLRAAETRLEGSRS